MIGKTANSEQFATRSGNHSTKGSVKGFSLLNDGANPVTVLTLEEKRRCLVLKLEAVKYLCAASKTKAEKQGYGMEIKELQAHIAAIRKSKKSLRPEEIPHIFIDVCRERLTKPMFNILMDEANRRQRENMNHNEKVTSNDKC